MGMPTANANGLYCCPEPSPLHYRILLAMSKTCVPAFPNSVGNSLFVQSGSSWLTFNPELRMHHINFKEFMCCNLSYKICMMETNLLKTKVSNHEIIRIPYQSEFQITMWAGMILLIMLLYSLVWSFESVSVWTDSSWFNKLSLIKIHYDCAI